MGRGGLDNALIKGHYISRQNIMNQAGRNENVKDRSSDDP
jgi:hypothetical protein